MTLHDEVEEFKDMAGIGRQARPYKERTSVLAPTALRSTSFFSQNS